MEFGSEYTDTARACGDWLIWQRIGSGEFSELMGWRPGLREPVVVRPEVEDVELTTPACADDRWLTTRADNISGRNETLALWTLDTEKLT